VYLPRVFDATDEPPALPDEPDDILGTGTILLAEDEQGVRDIAVLTLTRAGYEVLPAATGRQALEVADGHPDTIDLLVTDVVMGKMSGRELAQQLDRKRPGIRTLYISGYAENTIVHHGVLDPDVAFLAKPFTPSALVRKVGQVLNAPGGRG
jgi:CheY-like chemotaxis protein